MGDLYAKVIIDISHEKVDRPFTYRVKEELRESVTAGVRVLIPFGAGNSLRKGYVVDLAREPGYDPEKIKNVAGVLEDDISVESTMIRLAWWIKERYGSTMNQALRTVLPVKQKVKSREVKKICLLLTEDRRQEAVAAARQKGHKARARLLTALGETAVIPFELAAREMNLSPSTLKSMEEKGMIRLESDRVYRNPLIRTGNRAEPLKLNAKQRDIAESFCREYESGIRSTYLIHGITGSGKTEVYMELISRVLEDGKQVIVLIPEIALTYQTVMRFYARFGDRIAILNSRLSRGERYDQLDRAKNGEVDIMIGPRSALFTPFSNLGLIIMDEEHEAAYKSETVPRYHARETAIQRAAMSNASVVLGSATPSLEAYTKAAAGEYRLFVLDERAKKDSFLASAEVVDLRFELLEGNKSIFSRRLKELILDRLSRGEQIMLFLNRRGYANFVSCRSCGEAVKCPHCDVTLTLHGTKTLICHYCGHSLRLPEHCPNCGSPYIAQFGVGTQKAECLTKRMFPEAKVLRMDLDTTARKGSHEEILAAFSEGEADILIGTQMIVKGHDFPNVTLVGILAADLSLYTPDFRSAERTFQLLTQAAGRAGRGRRPGNVVIQTYNPDHYSISAAAAQDYRGFYQKEMAYRRLMKYPPSCQLFTISLSSKREEALNLAASELSAFLEKENADWRAEIIGPVQAPIYKVNDIYRKILYIKQENYDILFKIRSRADQMTAELQDLFRDVSVQYDFS